MPSAGWLSKAMNGPSTRTSAICAASWNPASTSSPSTGSATSSRADMTQYTSVRSIRNRLFLLLLRAFGIAVALLVLFTLVGTTFFLSRPLRANPLFQLPITSSLETYYVARGDWNGVSNVFDRSPGIEASQWRHSLLLDDQNRVIVQHGRMVPPANSWTYAATPTDIAIPIRANGAVAGTLIIEA